MPNGRCPCRRSPTPSPDAVRGRVHLHPGPLSPRGRAARTQGLSPEPALSRGSHGPGQDPGDGAGVCAPWMRHVGLQGGRAFLEGLSSLRVLAICPSAHSASRFRRSPHPMAVLTPGLSLAWSGEAWRCHTPEPHEACLQNTSPSACRWQGSALSSGLTGRLQG